MMDNKKSETLSSRVNDIVDPYVSAKNRGIDRFFLSSFIPGSSILYIGSDAEKNISLLNNLGFDAYGIEPSFIEKIRPDDSPGNNERIISSAIHSENLFFNRSFDAIICSGVMDKIPDKSVFDAAFNLRHNLKQGGRLLLSLADSFRSSDYYYLLFERLGFNRISLYQNSGAANDIIETVILFHLDAETGTRSIDKIESILNRDKKTATYKLALFRALTDIASGEYNNVKWYNDGNVGIPLRSIAEKWLFYYWPVFDSPVFIPQINGERDGCSMPVKFRKSLTSLIASYRSAGGVSSFYCQYVNNELTDQDNAVEKLLREIEATIVKGPVYYSGGSLDEGKVFSYSRTDRMVLIPADIWRELSLMWHWIGDALILRWGELTSRMSGGNISVSMVIDLLLDKTDPLRDTNLSRAFFAGDTSLECVWSGKPIHKGFDIDHVIPYTLWHNNDLWNLLPADPKVNNRKRDLLPARNLLIHRKDVIMDYWDRFTASDIAGVKKVDQRFKNEYGRFTGKLFGSDWHETLFAAVVEAVEFTAIQRGVGRWEG
jgi:hypothetical protein